MDRVLPNFICAFLLAISRLGSIVTCHFFTNLEQLCCGHRLMFLQHKKRCSGATVRFSDKSSFILVLSLVGTFAR